MEIDELEQLSVLIGKYIDDRMILIEDLKSAPTMYRRTRMEAIGRLGDVVSTAKLCHMAIEWTVNEKRWLANRRKSAA